MVGRRNLDQMAPHFFEQVSAFVGWERPHKMLLGRRQNAF